MNNTSCILTVIKNEHEYLDEWIKYHLNLGIEHIFILEDIDSLSHKEICDKYADKVTLKNVFDVYKNEKHKQEILQIKLEKRVNPQRVHIYMGLLYIKENYDYDWCFVIDNDEFITFEKPDDTLKNILHQFEKYDVFVLQWKCYGANGLANKPDYTNKGVLDIYTKPAEGKVTNSPVFWTKCCYNIKTFEKKFFCGQHQPSDECENWCKTDMHKHRLKEVFDKIYIRHYITRSWEEYSWKMNHRGYLAGWSRNIDLFFSINPDMKNKRNELIKTLNNKTLVVLPYIKGKSQGKELELALSLWKKYCTFDYQFIVIGEFDKELQQKFPWVSFIRYITQQKLDDQYTPHIDIQHKMEYIYNKYYKLYDGFIWMVDDNYAIKPFVLNDITTLHYHAPSFTGMKKYKPSYWLYDKYKTRQILDKENYPCVNYTTHFPCYFEFKKLKEIWDKYNMRNNSLVIEDIYYNSYEHEDPLLDKEIRLGVWNKDILKNEFDNAVNNPNIKFVCNSVEGWSEELEKKLEKLI